MRVKRLPSYTVCKCVKEWLTVPLAGPQSIVPPRHNPVSNLHGLISETWSNDSNVTKFFEVLVKHASL